MAILTHTLSVEKWKILGSNSDVPLQINVPFNHQLSYTYWTNFFLFELIRDTIIFTGNIW
jgi:hypothetical protein